MFNGPAILFVAICFAAFLMLSLVLAFDDTRRGFRLLFDPRVIRNFFRSMLRHWGRYSLRRLLVVAAILPPLLALAHWSGLLYSPDALALFGYLAIIVCPLVYWFFVEAFGPATRKRHRSCR